MPFITALTSQKTNKNIVSWGFSVVLLVFVYLYLANFYVGDDAFISFRGIENLITGYGFTYNTHERVQAFTNPLWMGLIGILKWLRFGTNFDPNDYWVMVFFTSFLCSLCAIYAIAKTLWPLNLSWIWNGIFWFAIFSSVTFIDFTSSGLEYPLGYLLIALFFTQYFALSYTRTISTPQTRNLVLLFSAACLMRLDCVLLFGLPILWVLWQSLRTNGPAATLRALIFGLSPLIAWELFSVAYYGFILPNTYYAKLGLDNPALIWNNGLDYVFHIWRKDPITILMIGLAIVLGLFGGVASALVSVSLIVALIYTVATGGDFMGGRFLALPFVLAVLAFLYARWQSTWLLKTELLILLVAAVVQPILSLSPFLAPIAAIVDYEPSRYVGAGQPLISKLTFHYLNNDKYGSYYRGSSLLNKFFDVPPGGVGLRDHSITRHTKAFPFVDFHALGSRAECFQERKLQEFNLKPHIQVGNAGGLNAFCMGPKAILVDTLALGDPLLARLPVANPNLFMPGHNIRRVPQGYPESIESKENRITDPQLAPYYERIRSVTQGPLWSSERLSNILYLNVIEKKYSTPYQ